MTEFNIQQKLEQLEQRLSAAENSLAGRIKTSAEWIAEQITLHETEKTAHQVLININQSHVKLKVALPGTNERIKDLKGNLARIDIALKELYKAREEITKSTQQSEPLDSSSMIEVPTTDSQNHKEKIDA